ncbi:MAG: hypothetical protein E6H69_05165 [Betaproteobacteria bacterium]|nr:MAG: hypothetical protein E6H69_05165 [Betaproteobacteria bacterium]
MALLGWSHGGSAVLASINRRHPVVTQFLAAEAPADMFYRTAVAFYPGCIESMRTQFGYAPATAVSIFIGESDDWTSAKPCVGSGRSNDRDEVHQVERTIEPRYRTAPDVHTIAPNPAAREDAYGRMKEQLRAALAP